MTRVYHTKSFRLANPEAVSNALRNDSYLSEIVDRCIVGVTLELAARKVCDELTRRGHYRTPCGRSSYSYHSVRRAIAGWDR